MTNDMFSFFPFPLARRIDTR